MARHRLLIDELMPQWHFNEVHAILIEAPPDRIERALKELTGREIPLVRLLFAIRSIPNVVLRKRPLRGAGSEPMLEGMLQTGFVLLGEIPEQEMVMGLIGQFWTPLGGLCRGITSVEDFLAFDRPGYAKATLNFSIHQSDVEPGYQLRTETRVFIPDRATRRKFGAYWRIVSPGSALIRRIWLRAVKRRAEQPES